MIIQITKSTGETLSNRKDGRPVFKTHKEKIEYILKKLRDDAKSGGSERTPSSLIGARFVFYKTYNDGTWDTITYILEKTTTNEDISSLLNYVYER